MAPALREVLDTFGASRFDECRELAQALILASDDSSTRADCVGILILSHLDQGNFAAARQAAERLRSVSPDVCQDLIADVNREERDYQAEVTRLQGIVATTKDPAEAARAQLRTARTHDKWGRAELAIESYLKVIDLNPDGISAARALRSAGRLYRQGGDTK